MNFNDPRLRRHELGFWEVIDKPSPEELSAYYAEQYYQLNKGSYRATYSNEERLFIESKIIQRAKVACDIRGDTKGRLLDVGCGEGFVIAHFLGKDWQVEGLDYSSAGLEAMNPHCAYTLTTGDVTSLLDERISSSLKYDIIWLNNVLEHVIDPVGLMERLHSLLEENGVLVVTVPNDFSRLQQHLLEAEHIDEKFWVALPDHLSYFDVNSLRAVGEATKYNCSKMLADFPVDLFLLNKGSNYIRDRSLGSAAHKSRVQLENLLAEQDIESVNHLYEAMANVGLGRNITAFFTRRLL